MNGLWRKDVLVLLETPVRGDVDSVGFVVCREISPPGMLPVREWKELKDLLEAQQSSTLDYEVW